MLILPPPSTKRMVSECTRTRSVATYSLGVSLSMCQSRVISVRRSELWISLALSFSGVMIGVGSTSDVDAISSASAGSTRSRRNKRVFMSLRPVLFDVCGEIGQRREDAPVVFVVGAQLEAVSLGDLQRELQGIDGIEAQSGSEQRSGGVDVLGFDRFEIEGGDDHRCDVAFEW